MKPLQIITVIQWIIMLPMLLRFLLAPMDLGTVGLWFINAGIATLTVPYGLWQLFRHPPRRAWAGALTTTALLCAGTPMVMSALAIGPVPPAVAIGLLVGLALLAAAWLLGHHAFPSAQGAGPQRLHRHLTASLLLAMALASLPLLAVAVFGLPLSRGASLRTGYLEWLLIVSALVGPVAALLAVTSLLYSLVGLWRDRSARVRHGLHCLLALALAAMLAALSTLLAIVLVNPG